MFDKILNVFGYEKKSETANQKTITDKWFPSYYAIGAGTSGENINNSNALTISAVYACINIISQDISKIPFPVYVPSEVGKEKVRNSLYTVLNHRANPETSAMDLRRVLTAHALNYGNGYAEIQRDLNGSVIALWVLPPTWVKPERDKDGNLIYRINSPNGTYYLFSHEVLHIKGLGFDGIQGYNVIQFANQTFGNSKAADKYAGSFFGNGSTMGGFLEHPENLSKEAQDRLLASIEGRHLGADKAHRVMVLEEGMKFNTYSIPPEQAQFLQTRQFNISEVARWFRVPNHKVNDLTKSSFNNIEEQSLDYVKDTLTTWMRAWEQEVWFKCLSEEEKAEGYYAEHKAEGLLRGDVKTRFETYAIGRQWGIYSVNDCLELENMNKVEGGDERLVPMNMTTLSSLAKENNNSSMLQSAYIKDIAGKLARKEIAELDKQLNRDDYDSDKYEEWFDRFYAKHNEYVIKTLSSLVKVEDTSLFTMQDKLTESNNQKEYFNVTKHSHQENIERAINEILK